MMKKILRAPILLASSLILVAPFLAESAIKAQSSDLPTTLSNGGFESSTLDGWTVEYGDAFSDDSVSSAKTFSYAEDPRHQEIPIQQEGNWHLNGKGFDGKANHGRTGAIRSEHFRLSGDGTISLKLAGGAITKGKGEAPYKDPTSLSYVGVYTAKNDRMVYKFINEYFMEHVEDYVDLNKYEKGVYCTDNFTEYTAWLDDYLGEEMYLRIVDNDKDVYYGYLSVDDIRIGGEGPQDPGVDYVKSRDYIEQATAPSQYEIANGGFETGSLAGWEVLEGLAFSNEGVNAESTWWNECITYDRDGNYHYGHYLPSGTGRMRSSEFILGGSGYVSFKLGGCMENDLTYVSFYVHDGERRVEVARYSNRKFWDFQFPYVANGMRILNMIQYVADLRPYLGKTMYIEIVDENASPEQKGAMTFDSFNTYYPEKPLFSNVDHYQALSMLSFDPEFESEFQVQNGTFETGDLTGWTPSWTEDSSRIGFVSNDSGWWGENYPYNKKGNYLFTGVSDEGNRGSIKSSTFKIGGIGKISFLLGGARHPRLCYVEMRNAETEAVLARYGNTYFHDINPDTGLINRGSNLLNMVQYVADVSAWTGTEVYLKVVDEAVNNWGLIAVDSFITYYADEAALPDKYYEAVNYYSSDPSLPPADPYQVPNGDFESGDLSDWTKENLVEEKDIGEVNAEPMWWNEWYSYNKEGHYYFGSVSGSSDPGRGTLTSSAFVVGGQNKMTFRLGGAKSTSLCRVELLNAETDEVVATYGNYLFTDRMPRKYAYSGKLIDLGKDGVHMANMVPYVADLSEFAGMSLKIRLVDEASEDWGLLIADAFITHYEEGQEIPEAFPAR